MKSILLSTLFLVANAGLLSAATIAVTPQASAIDTTFSVTVGLNGFGPPVGAVSGVSFDLNFDSTLLAFTGNYTFGDPGMTPNNQLALTTPGIGGVSLAAPGDVSIYYVSFDTAAELANSQAHSFQFLSLTFSIAGPTGTSALTLGNVDIIDQNANDITSSVTVDNNSVQITPEPSTGALFLAIPALWLLRRALPENS